MRLKNIVTKILFFTKRYFLLFLLIILLVLRFNFYNSPTRNDLNYQTIVTISNPLIIDDGTFVLKLNGLNFYSHIPYNYDIGQKLKLSGKRHNNAVYVNSVEKLPLNFLEKFLFKIKNLLVSKIKQSVLEPFASLLLGMLYGVEPNFSKDFNDILMRSGVIHVIVVSGYNLTILFSVIGSLIKNM